MTETQTKTKNRTKTKLVLDMLIFIAFLIAMEPRSSRITIHEWLATSLIAVLVVDLLLSWDWITRLTRRFIGKVNNQSRINYIFNWLLFIDGSIIMLSGFMISESLLPFLGISLPRGLPGVACMNFRPTCSSYCWVFIGLCIGVGWWIRSSVKCFNPSSTHLALPARQIGVNGSGKANRHRTC